MGLLPPRLSPAPDGRRRSAGPGRGRRATDIATERLIDQVNPALRDCARYRRRLAPMVARILAHSEALIEQIPGPLLLDAERWAQDPLAKALFANDGALRKAVSAPAVQTWLRQRAAAPPADLYGLMLALPQERIRFATEETGGPLPREVEQTTLGFVQAQIAAVESDLDALRQALVQPVADMIVSLGLSRLTAQEARISELEHALRMLELELKVTRPRATGIDLTVAADSHDRTELARLTAQIEQTEQALGSAREGLEDIEQYLARVLELLGRPADAIHFERMRVWLDRMNLVRDPGHPDAREILLMRAMQRDQPGRIALLVRFPSALVVDAGDRPATAEAHPGAGR